LFILATSQAKKHGDFISTKTTVSVQNILGDNSVLVVHCSSKDNDLGKRNVFVGAPLQWSFFVNVRETTLFRCTLQWDNLPEKTIVIYDAKIDLPLCTRRCWREVRPDGLYFLHDDDTELGFRRKDTHGDMIGIRF